MQQLEKRIQLLIEQNEREKEEALRQSINEKQDLTESYEAKLSQLREEF